MSLHKQQLLDFQDDIAEDLKAMFENRDMIGTTTWPKQFSEKLTPMFDKDSGDGIDVVSTVRMLYELLTAQVGEVEEFSYVDGVIYEIVRAIRRDVMRRFISMVNSSEWAKNDGGSNFIEDIYMEIDTTSAAFNAFDKTMEKI